MYMCIYMHTHFYIHTMPYYSVMRKKETLLLATTCMDPRGIMLSDVSQIEKGNCCCIHGI